MKKIYLLIFFALLFTDRLNAQVCGTPGFDGPQNIAVSINTYFPVPKNTLVPSGAKQITLEAVPPNDAYGNNFGLKPILAGDLVLIIQMQDATINYTNDIMYGANNPTSGPDMLGGTGYTNEGNTGIFEYVIATSTVPLTGGVLTFRGSGAGSGTVNTYYNEPASLTRGKRTFQVVRVPQYSNLILSKDISTPPFNGKVGGIIAFDVAGTMEFNGFKVDASARGFRGGYGPVGISGDNISSLYVTDQSDYRSTGKGEGIAGTPRFMWDGFNEVDNGEEGLPGGSFGRGAPGNAGGGGNDHNSGGGGGGNGGSGGMGGNGYGNNNFDDPNGGRPGSNIYNAVSPDLSRLIMGGGGGGGDANNAQNGVKGGVGGGIVLVNVKSIKGVGTILSNGGNGEVGLYGSNPDGAGGGGAGGTVFVKVISPDPGARLTITAKGGKGGNTERDQGPGSHGPGGGGGGGQIVYNIPASTVNLDVSKGASGVSENSSPHGAKDGQDGNTVPFTIASLPPYLQSAGSGCYPELTTTMFQDNGTALNYPGSIVTYVIRIVNAAGGGNAGGVRADVQLPAGFSYFSATATYTGGSGGPAVLTNSGSINRPALGDFNIAPAGEAIVTLKARVDCGTVSGTYQTSVQAIYFDPSRTLADPERRITAVINSFAGAKTTYESGFAANLPVPGTNYNGNSSSSDDVFVQQAEQIRDNTITGPSDQLFCYNQDPEIITGSVPSGGNPLNYSYQWQESTDDLNFTDIPGAVLKDFDPPPITITTYYRRIVFNIGCKVLESSSIMLRLAVEVVFDPLADVCEGIQPFKLTQAKEKWGTVSGNGAYSGDGITDGDTFNPAIAGPGTHTITYTFNTTTGCTATKSENIVVLPMPFVDAGPDETILQGGEVTLMATAMGSSEVTYQWMPSVGLNRYDVLKPVASPVNDITYILTVTSKLTGCINTDKVTVKVLKNPDIPNVFSPNGDGINDEWSIKFLNSYPNATIEVFNRFGEKVFSSGQGKKSWDGKCRGTLVPVGTYYYILNPHNSRKIISGSLTVLQ